MRCTGAMRERAIAVVIAAALLALPATSEAGAPNYDCLVAGGGRIAIDQWADVVAADGFAHRPRIWGSARNVQQDGPSLGLTADMRGAPWTVAVRTWGRSLVISQAGDTLSGHCSLVPGNFVLRRSDSGGFSLRAGPFSGARRLLGVPVGSAVWQDPSRTPHGRWLPVRTTIVRHGTLGFLHGWLRQRRPPVPRYPLGSGAR
jgi:hypothetical protein